MRKKFLNKILYSAYFLIVITFIFFHLIYAKKIVPGIFVRELDLGGKRPEEAVNLLQKDLIPPEKITLHIDNHTQEIYSKDFEFHYLYIDTVKKAFGVGRDANFFIDLKNKIAFLTGQISTEAEYGLDIEKLDSLIYRAKLEGVTEVKEPQYLYVDGFLEIEPGNAGETIDVEKTRDLIIDAILNNQEDVFVEKYTVNSQFDLMDLDFLLPQMKEIIKVDYSLVFEDRRWELSKDEIFRLIVPSKENGNLTLRVNESYLTQKLNALASQIDRNPSGQVLEVEGGKAVTFTASKPGLKLRIKESAEKISTGVLGKNPRIELAVVVTDPPEAENEFKIEDLLGAGRSKFKGSSASRIHNIGLASSRVSGTLVAPGDVFSFNESVGEIDRSTGYTSAWVISKGRTVLGDGGGVCQVSTTVFRAALNAGLPIVERNPHSYRVSYYEQESPVGIDATIYRPSVDLKFKNDTPGYILITSEFSEDNYSLVFKIYGQDDGRRVEITEPVVSSRYPPSGPIYEEDPTLKKGTKRQVEYPVWGATVSFSRKVYKGENLLYDDTFRSNYRAWTAVYRVGTAE